MVYTKKISKGDKRLPDCQSVHLYSCSVCHPFTKGSFSVSLVLYSVVSSTDSKLLTCNCVCSTESLVSDTYGEGLEARSVNERVYC